MRYRVRYLADGDEETAQVEADNAPEAVEAAQEGQEDAAVHFELLAVVPESDVQVTAG